MIEATYRSAADWTKKRILETRTYMYVSLPGDATRRGRQAVCGGLQWVKLAARMCPMSKKITIYYGP